MTIKEVILDRSVQMLMALINAEHKSRMIPDEYREGYVAALIDTKKILMAEPELLEWMPADMPIPPGEDDDRFAVAYRSGSYGVMDRKLIEFRRQLGVEEWMMLPRRKGNDL